MPTHAELTATLLRDAAAFFRNMAEANATIKKQMTENALAYEQMAQSLSQKPTAAAGTSTYAALSGDLLQNAATFFRSVAEQNEPIKEQMLRSADIYDQLAKLVSENPLGVMD